MTIQPHCERGCREIIGSIRYHQHEGNEKYDHLWRKMSSSELSPLGIIAYPTEMSIPCLRSFVNCLVQRCSCTGANPAETFDTLATLATRTCPREARAWIRSTLRAARGPNKIMSSNPHPPTSVASRRVSDGSRLALCQTLSIECPSSIFLWPVYFVIPVPFSLSFFVCLCFSFALIGAW